MDVKNALRRQYATLNPAALRRDMAVLQQKLYKMAASKRRPLTTQEVMEDVAYAAVS